MYRKKCKQSFFALHQIHTKIKNYNSDIEIEYHILWDTENNPELEYDKKWSELIDTYGFNIISYNKQIFIDYVIQCYDIPVDDIKLRLDMLPALYFILMGHYLRRVKLLDYYLIYDDDILINYDFVDVIEAALEKRPVFITEPYHQNCDKSLHKNLVELFGNDFHNVYTQKNPDYHGFNAGFQGIDLSLYDNFLSPVDFFNLINLFDYKKIFDENGTLLVEPYERTQFETQQQSFFGLCNTVFSKNEILILDPLTNYIAPTFGYHPILGEIKSDDGFNGWGTCLKSKISHFIGHTHEGKKPKEFLDRVDEYLINNNFNIDN